jgi:hypothetical protein
MLRICLISCTLVGYCILFRKTRVPMEFCEAVLLWFKEKQRHSKVHEKATNQEWYPGVFPESKNDQLNLSTNDLSNKCFSF